METASFFGDRAEAKSPKKIEWTAGEALKMEPNHVAPKKNHFPKEMALFI